MIDITLDTQSQPAVLRMAGELTIASAEQARLALLQSLQPLSEQQQPAFVVIDTSGVTAADTAGVQLLLATARQFSASAQTAVLRGCPPVLQRMASALGASDDTHCCGLQRAEKTGAPA